MVVVVVIVVYLPVNMCDPGQGDHLFINHCISMISQSGSGRSSGWSVVILSVSPDLTRAQVSWSKAGSFRVVGELQGPLATKGDFLRMIAFHEPVRFQCQTLLVLGMAISSRANTQHRGRGGQEARSRQGCSIYPRICRGGILQHAKY